MKLLDRLLLRNYFQAYLICFCSLVSLYIVIDLFRNLDDFIEASEGVSDMLGIVASFYAYQLVLIFDRLCGVIVLMAGMFTVAWMQRNNELVPLLSAGISMLRVLRPIFLGTVVMLAAGLANRELVMPLIADKLENPAGDPDGEKYKRVYGAYDANGVLIAGQVATRKDQLVHGFSCTIPEKLAGQLYNIRAEKAYYIPKGPRHQSGGWLLTEATPAELPKGKDGTPWNTPVLEVVDTGKYFLHTQQVDFDALTRHRSWYQFASTIELFQELQKPEPARLSAMAVQLHLRLTVPLLTFIMVLMGLSIILRDQGRNVFINTGLCLLLAGLFYAVGYLSKYLGEAEYLSPPLAAWLPVFVFAPLALAMMDAIHT